ncbi:hypothetical protein PUS82_00435 [Cytobacillus firmus]|uniref:hypothetical protein n=1 Tax=Cytobacillus firmus TaxID=1399 RepID=UPI00237A6512|nr:hypothetical protein [Cytobacillus firmus]MDD9309798.1 hypothetical protein [Cytobacillus firmus]
MAKCPHCKSNVKKVTEKQHYCSFCELIVTIEDSNKRYQLRGAVDHVDAAKPTKELMNYHTFDLLLLLRFCRQERRDTYQLMQTIGRAKHLGGQFAAAFQDAFSEYDYWTKKTRIAESLVKERIGTIPKAVTNDLLEQFYVSFQEAETAAPMKKYA